MSPAWISLGGAIFASCLAAAVAIRQSRLVAAQHREKALIDRDLAAKDVLARYREPLAAAAFDLQSRLYNILRLDFLGNFGGAHPRSGDAMTTTAFRLAQYFGWTEILRRDIQFLSFPEAEDTRRVIGLQRDIAQCFLAREYGEPLMIWADEQRALGEQMIVEEHGKVLSMGYARFREQRETTFAGLCARLRNELQQQAAERRLRDVQHLLCDLVETLDPDQLRYEAASLQRA